MEVWAWPRTDDTVLPGAAPLPVGITDTDSGFECKALGAPLRRRHLDLGAGTQGGDTTLRPGSWIFAALVVGGRLVVAGPGEQMEIHATQPLWARIYLPESSAVRAAECGCAPGLHVLMEGLVGGMWLRERPPPPPTAQGAAPAVG